MLISLFSDFYINYFDKSMIKIITPPSGMIETQTWQKTDFALSSRVVLAFWDWWILKNLPAWISSIHCRGQLYACDGIWICCFFWLENNIASMWMACYIRSVLSHDHMANGNFLSPLCLVIQLICPSFVFPPYLPILVTVCIMISLYLLFLTMNLYWCVLQVMKVYGHLLI